MHLSADNEIAKMLLNFYAFATLLADTPKCYFIILNFAILSVTLSYFDTSFDLPHLIYNRKKFLFMLKLKRNNPETND